MTATLRHTFVPAPAVPTRPLRRGPGWVPLGDSSNGTVRPTRPTTRPTTPAAPRVGTSHALYVAAAARRVDVRTDVRTDVRAGQPVAQQRYDTAVALRRRRVAWLVSAIVATLGAVMVADLGEASAGANPYPGAAVPVVVVHRGDTLWSIARRLHPRGDLRNTVARLSHARMRSGALAVGERIPVSS